MEQLSEQDPELLAKFPTAREVCEWMYSFSVTPEIKAAFTAIKRAAKKGKFPCNVYGSATSTEADDFLVEFLEARGYQVTKYTQKGGLFISWKPHNQ